MKDQTPKQLVSDSVPRNFRTFWYRRLNNDQRGFIDSVIEEVIKNPKAALSLVARNLIDKFSIKCNLNSVANGLGDMVDARKAT